MMSKKLVFVLVFVHCSLLCVFAQTGPGVIREMTGTVEIKAPGATSFVAAKVGDQLTQDTVISTGFKSLASVAIGHTLITVRPLTRLTLTEIQATAGVETVNVSLQSGRVRVDVTPPVGTRANMSVSSPTATASVRGTSFEFDTRNLYVNTGTVTFAGNRGQTVQVSAGGSSQVDADSRATTPIEERLAGALPLSPVGSDIAGIISTGPARQAVDLTISMRFYTGEK